MSGIDHRKRAGVLEGCAEGVENAGQTVDFVIESGHAGVYFLGALVEMIEGG